MGVVGLITIVILFIVLLTRKTVPQNWLSAMSANMQEWAGTRKRKWC